MRKNRNYSSIERGLNFWYNKSKKMSIIGEPLVANFLKDYMI